MIRNTIIIMKEKGQIHSPTMMFVLVSVLFAAITACQTNYDDNNLSQNADSSYQYLQFLGDGEQLYFMELQMGMDSRPIVQLRPFSNDYGDWPRITFEIEKDTLLVQGGTITIGTPVNLDGSNKEFFEKVKGVLNQSDIELPTANLSKGKYILNDRGIITEIIDNPVNLIYKRDVLIVVNGKDYGVEIKSYTIEDGQQKTVTGFIPVNGYMVIPRKVFKDIIRLDIGGVTLFPSDKEPTGVQGAIDKISSLSNLQYNNFENSNIIIKVFIAGKDGGFLNIQVGKNEPIDYYLPPENVVIFSTKKQDTIIKGESVTEIKHRVLW